MKKATKIIALLLSSVMGCSIALGACAPSNTEKPDGPGTENEKLSAPATLTYANGKLTWAAVTGATSYEVTVTKGTTEALKKTVTTTELDVSTLAAGDYTASVKALATGKTTSDAKTQTFTVAPAALEKLPTPTGIAYANGKVTWTAVTGATAGYLVKVTKKSDGSVAIAEKTVTTTELDVSTLAAGEYTISVTAKEVAGKNAASLPASQDFTVAAAVEKLSTPTGGALNVEARKVTWTAVPGATGYKVTVTAGGEKVIDETTEEPEIDVSDVEETPFTVTVIATADGKADSDPYTYNASVTAIALPAVTELSFANDKLTWKHAGGAVSFRVVVTSGQTQKLDEETDDAAVDGVYSYDLSTLGAGTYTASVTALADEYDVFRSDSTAATEEFTVASLGAYQAVEGLKVEGINIVWDENNARGYEITVTQKGQTQALDIKGAKAVGESFSFLETGLGAGDYTVTVKTKDDRHTGDAQSASIDITLTSVKTFDAAAIAQFNGDTSGNGEHGKAELIDENSKKVAKVIPTVDGWGRLASPVVSINYDKNPIFRIDVENVVLGGYHLQVRISGTDYSALRDTLKAGSTVKALTLEGKETGDPAVEMKGIQDTIFRLGVNGSTTPADNDAEVHFNSLSIWYLNEWKEEFSGKLEAVTGFEILNGMSVAWTGNENATGYTVTVKKGEETKATQTVTGTSYSVRDLEAGEYTLSVVATNTESEKITDSDAATYKFKVEYLASYTPEQMAEFTKIDGDETSVHHDSAKGYAIFNYEHKAGWGAYGPATGVGVNLANHPFAYVDIVGYEAAEGQDTVWLSRSKFKGENKVIRGDTKVAADSTDDLYVEIWKDENGNTITGTGAYQFGLGYTHNTSVLVNLIRIVQITPIEDLVHGTKTPLAAPSQVKEDKGVLSTNFIEGNTAYTPKYSVSVTEKEGGKSVHTATNLEAPQVDLAALALENGKTYVVSFKALGDNDFFVDSPEYKVDVEYKKVTLIDDFTGIDTTTNADKHGGETTFEIKEKKFWSTTPTNKNWGYDFMRLDLSKIFSQLDHDFYMQLLIDTENSTAAATIATRFINRKLEVVDTGYGETLAGASHLTKEWNDKYDEDTKVLDFAFGHGGNEVAGVENKVIVLSGIQFVKFIVKDHAE